MDVKQIRKTDFCMELQIEKNNTNEPFWVVFVYAITDIKERQ